MLLVVLAPTERPVAGYVGLHIAPFPENIKREVPAIRL